MGGGVVWQNKWGLTALAGYQFKSGWQIMGGPLWIPHGDTNGEAVACLGKPDVALLGGGTGEPKCCISIPYHVQGAKPLGAQAVAVYVFK